MREGNIFSLSTPHPRSGLGGYPILLIGGYPIPCLDKGVPHPRSRWGGGYPILGLDRGDPILLMGGTPIQDHDGGTPGLPPSKTGWGTPSPGLDGVPPPPPSAKRALAMRWAVCLLRSRRRTFLFVHTNAQITSKSPLCLLVFV